jgi:hypothetical protein
MLCRLLHPESNPLPPPPPKKKPQDSNTLKRDSLTYFSRASYALQVRRQFGIKKKWTPDKSQIASGVIPNLECLSVYSFKGET